MTIATETEVPRHSMLRAYQENGHFTDCYVADFPGSVSHHTFVEAFYTSALFKVERLLLKWFAARPSTDDEAGKLAKGQITSFAAWTVENHSENELMLVDFTGRTRSWLMACPDTSEPGRRRTRLYFGSAVVSRHTGSQSPSMNYTFYALLGFHRLYSRWLLGAACARLKKMQ